MARPTLLARGAAALAALAVGGKTIKAEDRITFVLSAASVDSWVFIADQALVVTKIEAVWSVAGGSGAAAKLRKVTDVSAPGASAGSTVKELQTAAFDLTTTANTVNTATLTATAADLNLAAGDKVGVDMAGTLTNLAGCIITMTVRPQ